MHWYDIEGNPKYEVPYADPKKGMRSTTLRDARKLNLLPSVTEILKIMEKPALNNWLQDRVLESALTLPRNDKETDKEYKLRIKKDSQEISLLARDTGSAIHDACESAFKNRTIDKKYKDIALKTKATIEKEIGGGLVSEQSFGSELGYGGKVDLNKYNVVVDIKTKEVLKAKMAYDEQIMQLVAYGHGLGYSIYETEYYNVFVSWDGDIKIHKWILFEEVDRAWKMFKACLSLWQLKHNYTPKIEQAIAKGKN